MSDTMKQLTPPDINAFFLHNDEVICNICQEGLCQKVPDNASKPVCDVCFLNLVIGRQPIGLVND